MRAAISLRLSVRGTETRRRFAYVKQPHTAVDRFALNRAADGKQPICRHSRSAWTEAKGRELIELYRIAGMGHGVPLRLGAGEGEAGAAGAHMLNVGLDPTAVRLPHLRTERHGRRVPPQSDAGDSAARRARRVAGE